MKKKNMNISFVDLRRQYKQLKPKIHQSLKKNLYKGDFILGQEVEKFEKEFAKYNRVKYTIGVASGTDALLLAFKALGIVSGDEVIAPVNTYISSVLPAVQLGAKVVFVDNDSLTYNIDVNKIEEKITKKTKAIVAVHLYGQIAEMAAIKKIAKKHNLFIVEDAAQAHGATYKNIKAGNFGDITCFSFYPGKNLGAYGDGGAVATNNKNLAEKVRILRNIGQRKKYLHIEQGYNSRLDNLQAAILRIKLKHLDDWTQKRRDNANYYNKLLSQINVITPVEIKESKGCYHLYVIRVKKKR